MWSRALAVWSCVALLSFSACSKREEPSQPAEPVGVASAPAVPVSSPAVQASTVFRTRCAVCHGQTGDGSGPGAAALNPKPRDYRDKAWHATVTDEQIRKTIVAGGAAVGKSPLMPANPDLQGKPEVLDELVKLIRNFGK